MPTQPAVLGSMRLGNFRLGYEPAALAPIRRARVRILLAGIEARSRVRVADLSIHDVINDTPNTNGLTIDGTPAPVARQTLRVLINSDAPRTLFAGSLQTVDTTYEGHEGSTPVVAYPCTAIDDTDRANRRRPFGTWTGISATTIGQTLATFEGLSAAGIALGLPTVSLNLDGSEGFSGGMTQLAKLIGGYWKVDDGVAYLFLTDTTDPPDAIDDTPGRFEDDPPIRLKIDTSQLRNRQGGKGHGEAVPADVAAGETIVPLADAVMFTPIGGKAIAGTTPDGAQVQILDYTGVQLGGAGSLVGPGTQPSTKPTPALAVGGSLTLGDHQWAYVWGTAAGKSLPSPLSVVVTAQSYTPPTPTFYTPPALHPLTTNFTSTTLVIGSSYTYKAVLITSTGAAISLQSAASTPGVTAVASSNDPAKSRAIQVIVLVPSHALLSGGQVLLYRSENGGAFNPAGFGPIPSGIVDDPSYSFAVTLDDYGSTAGSAYGGSAAGTFATANLSGIAIGPTGTTYREVYQTEAGGSQLKLQQTISNNTATTATASAADASLGANAPTGDTSGLTQPVGQVNAGSTSLVTASAGPFASGGGWALVNGGQQAFRYTGITGNTLTGIPASGVGSLVGTVKYSEHVDPAPALTGVTGLTLAMLKGTPVSIWVERNDLAAQVTQAAIDLANGITPADGIIEGPPIVDERRGEASLIALCDATLALYSSPIVTVTYACRDVKTKSGKTVHIEVTTPPIGPYDLTIQDVTISEIDLAPGTPPKFSVTASSVRWTLEGLLRQALAAASV